jgi:hypothetical protein
MRDKVGHTVGNAPEFRQVVPDYKWKLPETHIGIEIEAEQAYNIDMDALEPYWNVKEEGSIRGVGAELVLAQPLCGKDLSIALDVLDEVNRKRKFPLAFSDRCSDHIHLDVRDLTHGQLYAFILWYSIFERPIFKFAGGNRDKSVYAVPVYDAMENVRQMHKCDSDVNLLRLLQNEGGNNRYKYLAINIGAVGRFGSVEFRHHVGTDDKERLTKWINIIMCLKRAALNNDMDPEDLPTFISANGAQVVLEQVFEELAQDLTYDGIDIDIIQGVRVAQDIIFSPAMQKVFNKAFDQMLGQEGESMIDQFVNKNGPKKPKRKKVVEEDYEDFDEDFVLAP